MGTTQRASSLSVMRQADGKGGGFWVKRGTSPQQPPPSSWDHTSVGETTQISLQFIILSGRAPLPSRQLSALRPIYQTKQGQLDEGSYSHLA